MGEFRHDPASGLYCFFRELGKARRREYLAADLTWTPDPIQAKFLKNKPERFPTQLRLGQAEPIEVGAYRWVVVEVPPF